jgi:ankyrin repeat protein
LKDPGLGISNFSCGTSHGAEAIADEFENFTAKWPPSLLLAVQYGDSEVVRELLRTDAGRVAGVDIEAKDENGRTPLHYAAGGGRVELVRELLRTDAGRPAADKEARDEYGNTPLHKAAQWNIPKIVRILLTAGADIEARDEYGNTPLHLAAQFGNANAVKELLKIDTDRAVFAQNKNEETPLELAERAGHKDIVGLLQRSLHSVWYNKGQPIPPN